MNLLHSFTPLRSAKIHSFCLLGIIAGLVAIHLTLTWRSENVDLLSTSIMFWSATSFLVWDKRDTLSLSSDILSILGGVLLMAVVLLKSTHTSGYDVFLRLSPLMSVISFSLLASGVKGLKQYWQGLLLFSFLAIPPRLILLCVDLTALTAKFTTFVLWYLGFDISRQGVKLILPTGSVEVYGGCSGVGIIFQLLGLALILLLVFPTNLKQKIIFPIVAVLLGFLVNGVRVALLAVLVASSNQSQFDYWHLGEGSLLFSLLAALLFWVFCLVLLKAGRSKLQNL